MNYQELKAKRDELQRMLGQHSDMKGHRTYKAIEHQLIEVRKQIKDIFRESYNAKSRDN